jgi:hypothetical protein
LGPSASSRSDLAKLAEEALFVKWVVPMYAYVVKLQVWRTVGPPPRSGADGEPLDKSDDDQIGFFMILIRLHIYG